MAKPVSFVQKGECMEKDGFVYLGAQELNEAYTKDLYCFTFLSRDVLLVSIFKKGGDAILKTSSGKVYVSKKITRGGWTYEKQV